MRVSGSSRVRRPTNGLARSSRRSSAACKVRARRSQTNAEGAASRAEHRFDVALGRRCGHWAAQYRGFTEGHASAKIRYRGPHFTYTVFSLFLPDLCHVPRDMMLNRVRAIRAVRAKSDAPPTPHPDDSHASATRLMLVWVTREAASLARRKWQPGWHQRPARAARRFRPRAQCPAHSRAGPSCCGDLLDVGLACFAGAVSPTTSDTR